jgi:DNA-binding response OmpR family regulator
VDDDASVREMLGRVFRGEGYHVLSARNGEEALNIASRLRLDLVVLDLNLPLKNGWDIFERLSEVEPLVPVIIVTARSNQLFMALGAGAAALLEKPLDFPKLLETVSACLAEPAKVRVDRLAGRKAEFHYLPRSS